MQRITYIPPWEDPNDMGKGVVMGLQYPYIIGSPRGLGGIEASMVKESSPYAAGSPVYGLTLEGREITFFIHIRGATRREMYQERLRLTASLVPFNGRQWEKPGILYYENDYGRYWIPAIPTKSPDPQERIQHYNKADITFYCPDPFFRAGTPDGYEMIYLSALFEFPFEFDVEFGTSQYASIVVNNGTVATPVIIRITGTLLENPTITNERTGEFIRVIRSVGSDYELVINTSSFERYVKLVNLTTGEEQNAYSYLDLKSRFWSLLPGNNSILYHGDEENYNAKVTMTWFSRFAGV